MPANPDLDRLAPQAPANPLVPPAPSAPAALAVATAAAQHDHIAGWCKWCGMSLCLVRHPIHGCCSSHCYGSANGAW